mgnify:FL=1
MTNNTDKIRSLILAALMVFSVFAGTVALTGNAAAAANTIPSDSEPLQTGQSYFAGQNVSVTSLQTDTVYRVRELNDDDEPGTLVKSTNSGTDGTIAFELNGRLSDGDFVIVNPDGTPINVNESGFGSTSSLASDGSVNNSDQFEAVTMDLPA